MPAARPRAERRRASPRAPARRGPRRLERLAARVRRSARVDAARPPGVSAVARRDLGTEEALPLALADLEEARFGAHRDRARRQAP